MVLALVLGEPWASGEPNLRQKRYATSILAKFASVVSLSCTKMKLVQAWLLA